jgi:hypothetical protein
MFGANFGNVLPKEGDFTKSGTGHKKRDLQKIAAAVEK